MEHGIETIDVVIWLTRDDTGQVWCASEAVDHDIIGGAVPVIDFKKLLRELRKHTDPQYNVLMTGICPPDMLGLE